MNSTIQLRLHFLLIFILISLSSTENICADELSSSAVNFLHAKYSRIEPLLLKNTFNMPLYVESKEEADKAGVDVYGVVEHSFETVRNVLEKPANWCDIALLHINDKACIYRQSGQEWHLTLYSGRKYYQTPEEAHQLHYTFHIKARQNNYLALQLNAPNGPLSTADHRIIAELIPLTKEKTLLHLSYRFGFGTLGRLAMKSYFATLGRGKIGFSVTGTDEHGAPLYVRGIKGAIERNVVRYYCAILSFLDALNHPGEQQFEKRISRWFDLTEQHKKQLHEIEKDKYLSNKRLEHKNQILLQMKAGSTAISHP